MARGIRPGQVPDWRPGAEFWKPLADGREVTVYPLLGGKGRLCVGPLADPNGYDIAYRYESVAAAIEAAKHWDGEETENPPDFEEIEFGGDRHPGTLSNPAEDDIPKIGDYILPRGSDDISMSSTATGQIRVKMHRYLLSGDQVAIEGMKVVRTDGVVLVEVHEVEIKKGVAPHHAVQKRGVVTPNSNQWPEQTGRKTGGTTGAPPSPNQRRNVIDGLTRKRDG